MSESGTTAEGNLFTLTTAATSLAMLAVYYIFKVAQKPTIFTGNLLLQKFLDDHMPSLKEKYWPSWYSWEGRLQSALGLNLRISSKETLPYRREILELKDGGQLAVDFLGENENKDVADDEKLLVFLLPGLTSHSNTSYVKTMCLSIVRAGAVVAILNNRGLGGVPLKTPRTYCAANHEDVREVIAHLKKTFPNHKMIAIGASLGGMTIGRYLINHPEEAKDTFLAAMVISICWDPMVGTASIEKPFVNRYIVNYTLTTNMQNLANKHRTVLETRDCWDMEKVFGSKTLREFDHHFTAPQFGFKSCEEYYKAAKISPEIEKFSIPVIGLNARDDPMSPGDDLPIQQATDDRSKLALIVTSRGGHLGWLEGALPVRRKFHYMERVVFEFVKAVRENSSELLYIRDAQEKRNLFASDIYQ
ncbi:Phospholipase ABHD3 [Orchesella cincta]|uniref:Phospholipase ABHD3 n=1 Tax=Orchesella cincta TaxID=48709 RepID=A0A1D2NIY3_ORCCI|nr:Phospholipase ABHD3 [Orchesella cincta]